MEKDSLLSLEDDIFWPSDKSGQISSGLDITTNSEASGSLLEEGVSLDLRGLGGFTCLLIELSWWLKKMNKGKMRKTNHFASLL